MLKHPAQVCPDLRRRIGIVLCSYRQGLGLRQRDVAEKVGVDQAMVSMLEGGGRYGMLMLERVSVVLGRSLSETIRDAEDMEWPEVVKRYQKTRVMVG